MKKNRIQICPQCQSPNIETDFSNAAGIARGFLEVKKCNNCSHHGTFFPTVNIKELKEKSAIKKAKNVKHFDESFAKGITAYVFGIGGLFFLLISVIAFIYRAYTPALLNLVFTIILLGIYFFSKRSKSSMPKK